MNDSVQTAAGERPAIVDAPDRRSFATHCSTAMPINAGMLSSDRETWETPPEIFDRCNAEFRFTLDVCALPENAKCEQYFTPDDDGLQQQWTGTCWMNPPYGREIGKWMQKAYEASQQGATVVCLVPARTDTAWWHDWAMKGDIRFLRKRVKFVGAASCAPFPSALVIFRPRWWESR